MRAGGSTLFPEELELVGELSGRSLVHLCCNAGQDTLSLARLGARATGIDISDEAIAFAKQLASESGIRAEFERADIYDWLPRAARDRRRFDRVFMTYGVLGWMSILDLLFRGIAGVLEHGGRVVSLEFHPAAMVFDEKLKLKYPYFGHAGPLSLGRRRERLRGALGPGADAERLGRRREGLQEPARRVGVSAFGVGAGGRGHRRRADASTPCASGPTPTASARSKRCASSPGAGSRVPEDKPELPLMLGLVATRP